MKKMKKIISTISAISLLAAMCVVPSVNAEGEDAAQSEAYKVLYDLNYDSITGTWDYAQGGLEGSSAVESNDGFSGKSIKMTTSDSGYATFRPNRGWDGSSCYIDLTEGKTYIMSFKVKKIHPTATVGLSGIRDNKGKWVWGYGEAFKPADTGWRSVSYQFKAGETIGAGAVFLAEPPQFVYNANDANNTGVNEEPIILIDDFRTVQINDTSILNGTEPTATVSEISSNAISVTFSQEMMQSDVTNPKAYIINGAEAQSVTYDAATKTATVVPATDLTYGSDVTVAVSAGDYLGRALYTETTQKYVTKVSMVSTTLPETGTNAELGYNEYTMTFNKDITSAQVTYNGKTTAATVSAADAKTISFGLATIANGDVTISVTDTDGGALTVTKAITVPNTLVAYTGFDKGTSYMQNYLYNNKWNGPFVTEGYRSPGHAAKLVTTDTYGYSVGLCEWGESKVDYGPKSTAIPDAAGDPLKMTRAIESGKWYKVSFYAKAATAGQKPQLGVARCKASGEGEGVARCKASGEGEGVAMFEMTDTLTKYEATFKAVSTKLPFLYREKMEYEIILDDLLIEEIESPYDFTYDLSAKTVTENTPITATLSNEKLDAMNGCALIALYKDGRLTEIKTQEVTNLTKGNSVTTDAVTVPADISDGVYTVKAFLWENVTTSLEPICDVRIISEPAVAESAAQ